MSIEIRMPKLSDTMEEGTILRWYKKPGDTVDEGEPLAEVETEKADVEVEAESSGTLEEIRVPEGQSVPVGQVIATLSGDDGGERPAAKAEAPEPEAARREEPEAREVQVEKEHEKKAARVKQAPAQERERAPAEFGPATERPEARREEAKAAAKRAEAPARKAEPRLDVQASPLAWRLAEDLSVDLRKIRGSGPGGRILKRDVEEAAGKAEAPGGPPPAGRAPSPEEAVPSALESRVEEPSRMRQAIARRMAEAKRDIPHFYISTEINMSEAVRLRRLIKESGKIRDLTVTHLLVKALSMTLLRHPRLNASWRDGRVEFYDAVHMGIAVAIEDGLIVPVLHHADKLSLAEVAVRTAALTEKARSGRFGGDDLTGGTFSLSNVGMLDVDELVAVINPPQAALLGVGAVKDRPIVRDGQLAVARTMRATLSCDHRVLNGIEAGRFLEDLKRLLEGPVALLLE